MDYRMNMNWNKNNKSLLQNMIYISEHMFNSKFKIP
jgi:hypothetical protein